MSRRSVECESKTSYPDRPAAERARLWSIVRRGASPSLASYRCRFGPHWHIGHRGAGTNGRAAPRRRRGHRRA